MFVFGEQTAGFHVQNVNHFPVPVTQQENGVGTCECVPSSGGQVIGDYKVPPLSGPCFFGVVCLAAIHLSDGHKLMDADIDNFDKMVSDQSTYMPHCTTTGA